MRCGPPFSFQEAQGQGEAAGPRSEPEGRLVLIGWAIEGQDFLTDKIADDGGRDDIRSPMFVVVHSRDRHKRSQTIGYGPDEEAVGLPGDDRGHGKGRGGVARGKGVLIILRAEPVEGTGSLPGQRT